MWLITSALSLMIGLPMVIALGAMTALLIATLFAVPVLGLLSLTSLWKNRPKHRNRGNGALPLSSRILESRMKAWSPVRPGLRGARGYG